MVRDYKGNFYKVLEENTQTVLLECSLSGIRVRIRAWGWDQIGFVRP